jgi:hypothetical protein
MARLTSNGIVFDIANPSNSINSYYWLYPQGTRKLFYQASAPVGWTQVTTATSPGPVNTNINNLALRVVNNTTNGGTWGTGGVQGNIGQAFTTILTGTGGNLSFSYSGTFPIGVPVPLATIIGPTTLSISQLPNHTHQGTVAGINGANATPFSNAGARVINGTNATGQMIESTGGGSHTHPFSGTVTFTNVTSAGDILLDVQYIDVIVCQLD